MIIALSGLEPNVRDTGVTQRPPTDKIGRDGQPIVDPNPPTTTNQPPTADSKPTTTQYLVLGGVTVVAFGLTYLLIKEYT